MGASGVPRSSGHRAFAFGSFVADTVTRRLWREGQPVPITAKTFDVLAVLLEHRDRLVTKDELLDRVWPDTAVQENNLARQVSSLRRVLGQRPDEADFVLTVPGHGYRFVSDAQEIAELPGGLRDANGIHHLVSPEPSGEIDDLPAEDGLPKPPAFVTVNGDGLGSGSSSAATRRWSVATVVGIAALLISVGLAATLLRRTDSSPETRRTLLRVTFDDAGLSRDASWSADGHWIVFVSDRGGNTDLWKQRIGDPDPVRLTMSEVSESQPEWSPDGRSIVFRSERDGGGLYLIPADGGVERMVSGFGYEPHWSADSTHILFKRSEILPDLPTIHVVGLDGRPPLPLHPDVLGQFRSLHAAWHPDGRRVSVWGTDQRGAVRFLNVPLGTGDVTESKISAALERNLEGITPGRFVWARSGRYLYFEGLASDTNNVWRITADPSTGDLTDGPVRLTTGTAQETHVAVSRDGQKILFTS